MNLAREAESYLTCVGFLVSKLNLAREVKSYRMCVDVGIKGFVFPSEKQNMFKTHKFQEYLRVPNSSVVNQFLTTMTLPD